MNFEFLPQLLLLLLAMYVTAHCGDQRTTLWGWLSALTFRWDPANQTPVTTLQWEAPSPTGPNKKNFTKLRLS